MSTSSPLSGVQLGDVSVSGPHSIMEIGEIHLNEVPQQLIKEENMNKDCGVSPMNNLELPTKSEDGEAAVSTVKRPPPLEMTQDPSLMSADGPKTPISPMGKSGTMKAGDKEKKIGHRRIGEGGEVTYKKIQTSQIMGSIQLGISNAVGGLASKPERDLLMQDFMALETIIFPPQGSQVTPAHHYSEFRYKTYAPIAFRYFRDLFGIQPDDFLLSLCNESLRELSNPGASGSIFYLSADDEFIIKTVQHKEGEFLMKLLLGYYMNLNQNPRTLLPKFFGLYCYQCNSKNVRMVVMNNILPSSVKLHEKYDLKGSTFKRKASKSERTKSVPTHKDLDFMEIHPEGILLEADTYTALIKTIQRDCRVLESFKIMDYSLLVGIHNLDLAAREEAERRRNNSACDEESGDENGATAGTSSGVTTANCQPLLVRSRSVNRQKLVAHSTALESIQAESEPIDEEDDVPPGGIPARNVKGERLLLFLGIIDILQSYRLVKKLEHTLKAMIHDGDTVSVHRPGFYSQRFQDFMAEKVFKRVQSPLKHSPSKRKLAARTRATSIAEGCSGTITGGTSNDATVTGSQESATEGVVSPSSSGGGGDFGGGRTNSAGNSTSPLSTIPLNLPAVLKDRIPGLRTQSSRGPPPPVPPRSPRRVNISVAGKSVNNSTGSKVSFRSKAHEEGDSHSLPSTSSTPPPAFEEVLRTPNMGPVQVLRHKQMGSWNWNTQVETLSMSEVLLEARSDSKASSLSMESGMRTGVPSTAPTPTWTEGTPSYTESSSSGDLAFPDTPQRHANSPRVRRNAKDTRDKYQETEMVSVVPIP